MAKRKGGGNFGVPSKRAISLANDWQAPAKLGDLQSDYAKRSPKSDQGAVAEGQRDLFAPKEGEC